MTPILTTYVHNYVVLSNISIYIPSGYVLSLTYCNDIDKFIDMQSIVPCIPTNQLYRIVYDCLSNHDS